MPILSIVQDNQNYILLTIDHSEEQKRWKFSGRLCYPSSSHQIAPCQGSAPAFNVLAVGVYFNPCNLEGRSRGEGRHKRGTAIMAPKEGHKIYHGNTNFTSRISNAEMPTHINGCTLL